MGLKVLKTGLATSIQDIGRLGYAAWGVPQSGVMDPFMSNIANRLIGNKKEAAVLEIAWIGPKLQFRATHFLVLSGLEVEAFLNEQKVALHIPFLVKAGDILEIKRVKVGNFAYLAVNGGFQTEKVLSSRSFYEGITKHNVIKEGEVIPAFTFKKALEPTHTKIDFDISCYQKNSLLVFPGPEFYLLSEKQKIALAKQAFTPAPNSNRMAFLFQETIASHSISMRTSAVLPGIIQLTTDGHLIALMRDAQVTGGYPRILQMAEKQLPILAQKRPGEEVRFRLKEISES